MQSRQGGQAFRVSNSITLALQTNKPSSYSREIVNLFYRFVRLAFKQLHSYIRGISIFRSDIVCRSNVQNRRLDKNTRPDKQELSVSEV